MKSSFFENLLLIIAFSLYILSLFTPMYVQSADPGNWAIGPNGNTLTGLGILLLVPFEAFFLILSLNILQGLLLLAVWSPNVLFIIALVLANKKRHSSRMTALVIQFIAFILAAMSIYYVTTAGDYLTTGYYIWLLSLIVFAIYCLLKLWNLKYEAPQSAIVSQ